MMLPMFPLGSVVFPYAAIPLRVFEARYQALVDDVLGGDRTLGTVLIERGSEVGGGDQRFTVGTRLRVVSVGRMSEADHRQVVVAGTGRIKVDSWAGEDPYPHAEVSEFPDHQETVPATLISETVQQVRRVLALASELGADTGSIAVELEGNPLTVSYRIAALTPVTPLDSYRLLTAPGPATRMEMARQMLADSADILTARLGET